MSDPRLLDSEDRFSSSREEFEYALRRLNLVTRQLNLITSMIVILTMLNIISTFITPLSERGSWYGAANVYTSLPSASSRLLFNLFPPALLTLALTTLFIFDRVKGHGDVIFEVLIQADEWQHSPVQSSLRVRLALREYTRSTILPFVPGKFGAAAYAALHLMLALVTPLLSLR